MVHGRELHAMAMAFLARRFHEVDRASLLGLSAPQLLGLVVSVSLDPNSIKIPGALFL